MIKKVGLICLLISFGALRGSAALASYTFETESSVPTVANLTFGQFTRVNLGLDSTPVTGEFGSSAWTTGGSINTAEYVSFTVQPAADHQFTFTDLALDTISSQKKGGANHGGATRLDIRIFSLDGLTQLAAFGMQSLPANDVSVHKTWDFSDLTTSSGFSVRIYGWKAEDSIGSLSFDNIDINGSVTPVPEPANVALGIFGAGAIGVTLGRRVLKTRRA